MLELLWNPDQMVSDALLYLDIVNKNWSIDGHKIALPSVGRSSVTWPNLRPVCFLMKEIFT